MSPTGLLDIARPLAEPDWDAREGADDDFTLDVRVIVAFAPIGMAPCPTDDGCGNTCSGNDSSCNSFVDDPA